MATIVGKRSNAAKDPMQAALAEFRNRLSLATVRDSLSASRYAVSSVNPGGTPSLVGAQITPGTSGASKSLLPTGVTPGRYGDATHIGQFTVNAQGLLTQAAAIEFSAGGAPVQVKTVTAPYTVASADVPGASAYRGAIVVNSSSATPVTIDTFANTAIPVGAEITFVQQGAGAVTITAAVGVSFVAGTITGGGAGAVGHAVQIAQDVWAVSGNLAWSNGGDPYWNNVMYLLHGNGANNGTVFTDQKGSTWSASSGAPVTSTAQSKFNGSSIYLNGSSALSTPFNSAWHLGAQDFTIDAWVYPTSASGIVAQILVDTAYAGYAEGSVFTSSGTDFLLETSSGTWTYESGAAIGLNAWHFVRATRASGSCNLWVDGVLVVGPFSAPSAVSNSGVSYFGQSTYSGGQFFTGYLAELRYTLGVARTGTEVPTAPFPDYGT